MQKALYNHHRGHTRASLCARPREGRKRTPKTTSALEYSAQTRRIHMWEHVEVINRAETLHSPHQDHEKDGGIRYGSGVHLDIRRLVSTCSLARACPRCVLLKWSGIQKWGSRRKTGKSLNLFSHKTVCGGAAAWRRSMPARSHAHAP